MLRRRLARVHEKNENKYTIAELSFSGEQINGALIKTPNYGWQIHLHPTTILQGDGVAIIIDMIEQNLG